MNINYCGYIQVVADYKKKYINPLPGITKEHALLYSGLFINDQVYKRRTESRWIIQVLR